MRGIEPIPILIQQREHNGISSLLRGDLTRQNILGAPV